jgi:hypothetical protein
LSATDIDTTNDGLTYWDDFDVNAVNHKVFCKGKGSVNVVGSGDGEGDWECVCDFSGIDF